LALKRKAQPDCGPRARVAPSGSTKSIAILNLKCGSLNLSRLLSSLPSPTNYPAPLLKYNSGIKALPLNNKMRSSNALLVAIAASVAAKTITINVGDSGLVFTPDATTANVGDTIEFHFFASFHTAVQGDFNNPCQRAISGFNSGPINNNADGSVRDSLVSTSLHLPIPLTVHAIPFISVLC
jgi:plastocyanin